MVEVKVETVRVLRSLQEAQKTVGDLRPAFIAITKSWLQANKATFRLKSAGRFTDYVGPKVKETWKSPGIPEARTRDGDLTAYENYKKKKVGFVYPMLKFTGRLESSITESAHPEFINVITPKSLTLGTAVPYGIYHESSEARKTRMPMRKFLFIDPTNVNADPDAAFEGRYKKIIDDFVSRSLGKAGLGGAE